jgi:hypothetical protein
VASYRDRYDPETIHFPAALSSKFLVICGLFVNAVTAAGCLLTHQSRERTVIELSALGGLSLLLILAWPRDLRIELRGVASHWLLGRRVFIPWAEVAEARRADRVIGPGRRVLYRYVVAAADGRRIVHTARHPDRERFVFELQRHGAAAEDAFEE